MIPGPVKEMLARNSTFAQTYRAGPGLVQMATAMRATGAGVVVLSCSDPRLNPYQILGLDQTLKATMVRNAGGRVFDAVRTLAVLQTIGAPGTIVVMHHTAIKKTLTEIAPEASQSIEASSFGEITGSIEESIQQDLALLKASPLIRNTTLLVGMKYDTHTGVLTVVETSGAEDAQAASL
ncbi:hypothetical protein LTR27_005074 [Elasticomyces elasticus]|nr:hypothetical protein LTR27_005074 [Elasticomyces elasticus]